MDLLKKRHLKSIKKILNSMELEKELIELISKNSYINLEQNFEFMPSIKNHLSTEEIYDYEEYINNNLDRDSKTFKELFKKISKKKNLKYQYLLDLEDVKVLVIKEDEGIHISCAKENKEKVSALNLKWLDKIIDSKKGVSLSFELFETLYPEIEKLQQLGLTVVYPKGKSKAKIGIFPAGQESFFSTDDIFSRKVILDEEEIDTSLFKDLIKGNILFYKDKLIEVDAEFLKEIQKEEKLQYIDLVRENIENSKAIDSKLKEFLDSQIKFRKIKAPQMKLITLEDYQKDGVEWLVNNCLNHFGSILADDMGLGKTVQTIASIQYLKEYLNSIKVLVIVPTAVLLNWEHEIKSFSTLSSSLYYGANREINDADVTLTTYGTVTYDDLLKEHEWDLIVIDEAQKIKNHDSIIANKINLIPSKSRIALTGTPVENNLMDLWSIFNFIIPGYLGSKELFKKKYIGKQLSEESIELLKKTIDPFILRREKSILPLPEKIIKDELIEMCKEQELIYNNLVDESLEAIEKLDSNENGKRLGIILSTITRLKQVCNHPGNYSDEFRELESGKLIKLQKIVADVLDKEEKIIIFTQYVAMANILSETFDNSLVFHGGLNIKERLEILNKFKNGKNDVLIISLKAGGTGLNIVEANHVVHYDLWFNPAVENQATDRAYRRGQNKDVFVTRFISKGTFEEKINDMLLSKRDLFDKTMNNQGLSYFTKMDNDELKDLFSFSSKI